MRARLEILKKLFIRENNDPKSIEFLNDCLSNPVCTVIKYSGIISENFEEQEIDDGIWTDPDGDYILQSPFSPSLHSKEYNNEIVSIRIDPDANPKDVIRLINKISKDINDHHLERIYDRQKYLSNILDAKTKGDQSKDEYKFREINKDSSYREVMLALLENLEKYEESEWLKQNQVQEYLRQRLRKEDVRITSQLSDSSWKRVDFGGLTKHVDWCRYSDNSDDYPF